MSIIITKNVLIKLIDQGGNMKALILNSGLGSRMGDLTKEKPKCMTKIKENETIVSRQLQQLSEQGINEVVMTTGPFEGELKKHCQELELPIKISFIQNPVYKDTNYIYSIYGAKELLHDDIVLMHGDLVFDEMVLKNVCKSEKSCMTVSSTVPLPEKDFKAVLNNGKIQKVGIEFFDNAVAAQPLYKIKKEDWEIWLNNIVNFCENNNRKCYAENAFNEVSDKCNIYPLDIKNELCSEIDTLQDLNEVSKKLI